MGEDPMRRILLFAFLSLSIAAAANAAQLKGLSDRINKANQGAEKAEKAIKEFALEQQDEIAVGEQVSARIRAKYGVVQDPAIHKYVGLVGIAVARKSTRANLPWQFFVLDTDGVNAFAAPGGFIHITRGALALMTNEAELAGVLGHEISHVTRKHTIKALQEDKGIQAGVNKSGSEQKLKDSPELLQQAADKVYAGVFAGFGRKEELEADADGPPLAAQAGYLPLGLSVFLRTLDMRNSDSQQKQGLFASHPEMTERIDKIAAAAANDKSGAMAILLDRFELNVKYKPVPLGALTVVDDPAAGAPPAEPKKQEEKKPSRFSLSNIKNPLAGGSESKQGAAVTGSAGSRGVDRERLAKGGSNPNKVAVTITDMDIADFIKEGKLAA